MWCIYAIQILLYAIKVYFFRLGMNIVPLSPHVYIVMNKPVDYYTQIGTEYPSVYDLLPPERTDTLGGSVFSSRIHVVYDVPLYAEGLVLLTTDTERSELLRKQSSVVIDMSIDRPLTPDVRRLLQKGIHVGDLVIRNISIEKTTPKGKRIIVRVRVSPDQVISVGSVFEKLGYRVTGFRVIACGSATVGVLGVGKWKEVGKKIFTP